MNPLCLCLNSVVFNSPERSGETERSNIGSELARAVSGDHFYALEAHFEQERGKHMLNKLIFVQVRDFLTQTLSRCGSPSSTKPYNL